MLNFEEAEVLALYWRRVMTYWMRLRMVALWFWPWRRQPGLVGLMYFSRRSSGRDSCADQRAGSVLVQGAEGVEELGIDAGFVQFGVEQVEDAPSLKGSKSLTTTLEKCSKASLMF